MNTPRLHTHSTHTVTHTVRIPTHAQLGSRVNLGEYNRDSTNSYMWHDPTTHWILPTLTHMSHTHSPDAGCNDWAGTTASYTPQRGVRGIHSSPLRRMTASCAHGGMTRSYPLNLGPIPIEFGAHPHWIWGPSPLNLGPVPIEFGAHSNLNLGPIPIGIEAKLNLGATSVEFGDGVVRRWWCYEKRQLEVWACSFWMWGPFPLNVGHTLIWIWGHCCSIWGLCMLNLRHVECVAHLVALQQAAHWIWRILDAK